MMKLSYQEIEKLISEITVGRKSVLIEGERYYFRFPTREEKLEAELAYQKKLFQLRKNSIPTQKEILELAHSQSLYTLQDEQRYQRLEQDYFALLEKSRKAIPQFKQAFEKKLKKLETQLNCLGQKRNYIISHSADYISERHKLDTLLCLCTEDEIGEPVWDSVNIMLDTLSIENYNYLLNKFIEFLNGISVEKIRCVARSPLWQAIYGAAVDSNQPIFTEPASEWDINKIILIHWSSIYRNAFQNYGQIPDHILNDDAAFDRWLEQQTKKKNTKR